MEHEVFPDVGLGKCGGLPMVNASEATVHPILSYLDLFIHLSLYPLPRLFVYRAASLVWGDIRRLTLRSQSLEPTSPRVDFQVPTHHPFPFRYYIHFLFHIFSLDYYSLLSPS